MKNYFSFTLHVNRHITDDWPWHTKKRLGLVPEDATVNEVAYITLGSKVPFILHDLGNTLFRNAGESYVHGIMNGEFFENSEVNEQEIRIE